MENKKDDVKERSTKTVPHNNFSHDLHDWNWAVTNVNCAAAVAAAVDDGDNNNDDEREEKEEGNGVFLEEIKE